MLPLVVVLAVLVLAPSSASAATATFRRSAEITIPQQGPASLYPSTVLVRDLRGPVVEVEVALNGVSHTRPRDLDILLVAPDGAGTILMSDACGTVDVADHTWVFKSNTSFVPTMGQLSCPGLYYQATDLLGGVDDWPGAPAGPYHALRDFHRKALNGQWKLYVVDDEAGDQGKIARGWSLTLTTGPIDALLPGLGTFGPAEPYPITRTVGSVDEVITDMSVILPTLAHDRPDDVDLLLVGPRGHKAMLMSDACGTAPHENRIQFYDDAPNPLPDSAGPPACNVFVRPTDYEPGDQLPAPAPEGPYGTSLSAFDFTDPAGQWQLYAFDDADGADGYLANGNFELYLTTRPKATVAFAEGAVDVAEGSTRAVTVRRSAEGGVGEGAVTITSTPGSAISGADFTPIATTVQFARDEREKTILLDARADDAAEGAESYTVALSDPSGDATLGTQTRVDGTIPASARPDGASGGQDPTPQLVRRCAGKRATIVGTARRDVLRGTRRADVIAALAGNDTIKGARGNDIVCAGPGNDRVVGDGGRDRLLGGTGNDALTGGAGRDTCLGGRGRDRASCERKTSA